MARAELRAGFEAARRDRPELARTIDLHLDLLATAQGARPEVPASFPREAAQRLAGGRPAVDAATLDLDWAAAARAIRAVCEVVARHDHRRAGLARALAGLVGADPPGATAARKLAVRFLQGEDPVDLGAGVERGLAAFVLTHALRPFLRPFADAATATREAAAWTRPECPACGGPPDFAALEGEGGARRVLCARCDAEWAWRRVGCPFCGNEDPRTLAYFPAGDGAHRLYVCDRCRGYLKTLDLREIVRPAPLPVARVLAVGLDVAAARAGYGPVGTGRWRRDRLVEALDDSVEPLPGAPGAGPRNPTES